MKGGWAAVAVAVAVACGGGSRDSEDGSETAGVTEATDTAATTGSQSQPPSGQGCPLVGFYVACEGGGGQTFCDEIDGALRFGPCIEAPACDISGSASCDGHCELVAGVPTWVPEDGCFTSSVETDSG